MNLQRLLVNQMILDSPNGNQYLPNPLDWGLPESAATVPGDFPIGLPSRATSRIPSRRAMCFATPR